jgi:hypothetical protein
MASLCHNEAEIQRRTTHDLNSMRVAPGPLSTIRRGELDTNWGIGCIEAMHGKRKRKCLNTEMGDMSEATAGPPIHT